MSTTALEALTRKPRVAIVGGGLAGLSTAYHLLNKTDADSHVTVYDRAPVGTAGASAVAGGLVHPLSPRGKLVHWGMEGLTATNKLIDAACEAAAATGTTAGSGDDDTKAATSSIVLRNELYRVALTPQHVEQLQKTANLLPNVCEWLEPEALNKALVPGEAQKDDSAAGSPGNGRILGGIRMANGCKVIHLPSYLQALWKACEIQAKTNGSTATWSILPPPNSGDNVGAKPLQLDPYDAVVYAAGSGLFESDLGLFSEQEAATTNFPIQLVQGQSVELEMTSTYQERHQQQQQEALLCGKYVSPLPDSKFVLVGATHEFQKDALDKETVVKELKQRTCDVAPYLWNDQNFRIHRLTSGTRVQSERGAYGRLPIIGRLPESIHTNHENAWIFTGLSSRGLLYHGVYGDILSDAILEGTDEKMFSQHEGLNWWKKRMAAVNQEMT